MTLLELGALRSGVVSYLSHVSVRHSLAALEMQWPLARLVGSPVVILEPFRIPTAVPNGLGARSAKRAPPAHDSTISLERNEAFDP